MREKEKKPSEGRRTNRTNGIISQRKINPQPSTMIFVGLVAACSILAAALWQETSRRAERRITNMSLLAVGQTMKRIDYTIGWHFNAIAYTAAYATQARTTNLQDK